MTLSDDKEIEKITKQKKHKLSNKTIITALDHRSRCPKNKL